MKPQLVEYLLISDLVRLVPTKDFLRDIKDIAPSCHTALRKEGTHMLVDRSAPRDSLDDASMCIDREVISSTIDGDLLDNFQRNQDNDVEYNGENLTLLLSQICARQAEKIESLEYIFETSEHQLRHLLSVITVYAETLYLGLENNALQEQASILKDTTQQLRQHLNQLATKKQPPCAIQAIDLRQIFQASLKDLSLQIKQKELNILFPDSNALINGDPWQIKQVFDNLLHNTLYFAPSGTKVDCSWQVSQQEVLVEISDRGEGFSKEALQQALQPHYSTREDGTGLGLAIAQQIIAAHHGRLWIDNLPTGGALVSFILPRNLLF